MSVHSKFAAYSRLSWAPTALHIFDVPPRSRHAELKPETPPRTGIAPALDLRSEQTKDTVARDKVGTNRPPKRRSSNRTEGSRAGPEALKANRDETSSATVSVKLQARSIRRIAPAVKH